MNIEQLRKDMEAGTHGDWDNKGTHKLPTDFGVFAGHRAICSAGGYSDGKEKTYGENKANARRIARVPQLERIALAAEELYVATLNYQAHKLGTVLKLGKAQDKYREATK